MADPFSYRDVLTLWDRAKVQGEQRSLPEYSRFLNELYETDAFSEGERDGWWTRASTRADMALEGSVGQATGAVGEAIGGAFGYGELGREIGVQTPRMLLNAAPLFVPGVGLVAGSLATGAAMGAHTYAQTGDPKATAISGVAGAAMPWMGRVGGALGKRVAGAPQARGILTETGEASSQFWNKKVGDAVSQRISTTPGQFASEYVGSQAAQLGTEAYATHLQNPEVDLLSKDYLAEVALGTIPFTALDVYHGSKVLSRGLPTKGDVGRFTKVEEKGPEGKPYQPGLGTDEERAMLAQVLQEHEAIARGDDPKAKAEANGKLITGTLGAPDPLVQTTTPVNPPVVVPPVETPAPVLTEWEGGELQSFSRPLEGEESGRYNEWVDRRFEGVPVEAKTAVATRAKAPIVLSDTANRVQGPALINTEGQVLVQGRVGQTHSDLISQLDEAQMEAYLTQGEKAHVFVDNTGKVLNRENAWQLAKSKGQIKEEHRAKTREFLESQDLQEPDNVPFNVKEAVVAFSVAKEREVIALRKASAPVDDPERVADVNTPENKARIETLIKSGMRPSKALERVQQIIANKDLLHAERDQAIAVIVAQRAERRAKFEGREKTQYAKHAITKEDGSRFEATEDEVKAELERRGLNVDDYQIRTARSAAAGKYYAVEKLNRKVSLDIAGEHGGSLHEVIPDQSTQAVEDERNAERRNDFYSVEPEDTTERLDSLAAVRRNASMVANSLQTNEASILRVLDAAEKVMKGEKADFSEDDVRLAGEINGIMRKMDSERIRAVNAMTYPQGDEVRFAAFRGENGAEAWMDWFVAHPNSSHMGQLLADLRRITGTKVRSINDPTRPFEWSRITISEKDQTVLESGQINIPQVPLDDVDAFNKAFIIAEEYAHHATVSRMRSKDAAAVEFVAELKKMMTRVTESKHVPPRIRRAVNAMKENKWLDKFRKSHNAEMSELLLAEYDRFVGNKKEADKYRKLAYSLLDPEEFVGGVFGTEELPFILAQVRSDKSWAKTALIWFSKSWSRMFGVRVENESTLGEFLVRFERFMDGRTSEGYAARSYVADYLSSRIGVRPQELGVRTDAVMKLVATGDLSPYSTEFVDLTQDAGAVGKSVMVLPRQEVARHREIAERLQEDLEVVNELSSRLAKGFFGSKENITQSLWHGSSQWFDQPKPIRGELPWLSLAENQKVSEGFGTHLYEVGLKSNTKLWDYRNPQHLRELFGKVKSKEGFLDIYGDEVADYDFKKFRTDVVKGNPWPVEIARKHIKDLGYDGFITHETQQKWDDLSTKVETIAYHVFDENSIIPKRTFLDASLTKESSARLSSLLSSLDRQDRAIRRYDDLDNFDPTGWRDRVRSVDRPPPDPADPVPDLPQVQMFVGLRSSKEVRTEKSQERLQRGIVGTAVKFVENNVLLQQHLARINPAHAARADVLQTEHGMYNERQAALNFAQFVDMSTGKISKVIEDQHRMVMDNERLKRTFSDIGLIINEKQKQKLDPGWDDPDVQKRLNKLTSRAERDAVKAVFEGQVRKYKVFNETTWTTEFYDRVLPTEAAVTISAREGVLPKPARQMAQNFYTVLKGLQDAPNPALVEQLRGLASQLSPATSAKVIEQLQASLTAAKEHLDFNRGRKVYFNEQRYGKAQALMVGRDGQDIRISKDSFEELNKLVEQKVREGAKLLYAVDKEDTTAPSGQQRVIRFIEEIEAREQARGAINAKALEGVDDAATIAQVQETTGGIAESVRQAFASAKPLPGTQRRLVEGRETLDLLSQNEEFYNRANNWMRHRLTRANDSLERLHPEIAGDVELKKFGDQMLEAFLTPDNPIARKLTSMTFFYKLGFEFGNSFIESFQHATTGMQALIAQTGSAGDALELLRRASHDKWKFTFSKKWRNDEQAWFVQRLKEQGEDVAANVNDIHDPDEFARRRIAQGNVGQRAVGAVDNLSRRWSGVMQQYGNIVVGLAAFDHARASGMDMEGAYTFARGVKNLGMYTGGKSQRSGIFRIATKPIPQLMSSMQTYAMGWFGQMYSDWKIGFSKVKPAGYSKTQVEGARKAFIYGIAAQAALAGALGMPGMGQGLALLKQATGFDIPGWLRSNLAGLFEEDQEGGGLISGVALNGVLSVTTPFDPSSRMSAGFPLVPIDPYKGLTMERLAGAAGSTVSDFLEGTHALATGNRSGWEKILPNALKRPARLLMDDGNVRDDRGGLLYELSATEKAFTALGLPPTRIQRSRELSNAARAESDRAQRKREQLADELGSLGGKPAELQQRLIELAQEMPQESLVSLVKAAAKRYDRQNRPFDWREAANPMAELQGLRSKRPSTVGLGRMLEQDFLRAAGMNVRQNPRADARALLIDQLINSGVATTEADARRVLETQRVRHRNSVLNIPGL